MVDSTPISTSAGSSQDTQGTLGHPPPPQTPPYDAQAAYWEAKNRRDEVEHTARLRREEEAHEALLTQTRAQTAPPAPAALQDAIPDDIIGETPPEVLRVCSLVIGVPAKEVIAIFKGTFRPSNLYKLRPSRRTANDEGLISIVGNSVKIMKAQGDLKDFGTTIAIWSEGFLNYVVIINELFGLKHLGLVSAMLQFHGEIQRLATIYTWTSAVLDLAVDYHHYVAENGTIQNPLSWIVPERWERRFCTSSKELQKVGHALSTPSSPLSKSKYACNNFNSTRGCSSSTCIYLHQCKKCKATDHGTPTCKNRE
jgi:hypothetical protein